ncbi:MAG: nucleotidyl transferase AbiEii/AbiGii toxin family protein [Bacteroidales bacterium]|nr:nucleotidyl transferase AbiEii/AbiGii toxin family protein [Bacteroidales bacterium]
MINQKCFTSEWLEFFKNQKEHKQIQTNILEKMIHALHLLEQLKINGLEFVFKGGTSLVLLLEEGNRFSIDIDIICKTDRKELEKVLNNTVDKSNFTKVTLDVKRSYKPGVPKAHYIFEYESVFNIEVPGRILLDVLVDESIYPDLIESAIQTKWIVTNTTTLVTTPSINSITGDKLTAFAPNTIGIPYFKGGQPFTMEICKQLFDLSRLFERITNMELVSQSFQVHAIQEIDYRKDGKNKSDLTTEIVLQDTIDTCMIICRRETNKEDPAKSNFRLLQDGIKAFGTGYLMTGNFRIDDAVVASARVAHLAAKLLIGDLSPINYFTGQDIKPLIIEDQHWNFLNRLKRQPDKSSFYYWYHAVQLLTTAKK